MESENKIFGIRPVIEAIQAGRPIEKIMLREGIITDLLQMIQNKARANNISLAWVPTERLNRLCKGANHQGVIAFVASASYSDLEETLEKVKASEKTPLILLLDGVTDVRNFGAIARTAECAGVQAIVVPSKGAASMNADAMKTSAGALNYVPVCKTANLKSAIHLLRSYDICIVAADEKAENNYFDADFTKPSALILGSEESGISKQILTLADIRVRIPLAGKIESLNVSAAASAIMFESVRQRAI
ncbi:MAG: 23S rRNA (guanosine(2251)-2'-O)-methyltransferase RlmB [Prevotellaceae bacterium]|jgi:23S rRNA (guanosine2251-2'-O)-methyltransferase|nr:23S rRNA (guanosine(2251)-2'-O)-methyltransferase RlmB [Prevotellaceae bacterium]